jgi:adenine phosphoribosyltransferase
MDRLRASLVDTPVVEKDGYQYFVHPVSDGVPAIRPELLREIAVRIVREVDLDAVDKIVTPEAMGIHISTAVSLFTDIPVVVVRKRGYGLDGEVSLAAVTGYAESEMYINDVDAGDRVLVIDDVLSTGGTLSALLTALEEVGAEITDTVAVIRKADGESEVESRGYEVTSLIDVVVEDGEVVVVGDAE